MFKSVPMPPSFIVADTKKQVYSKYLLYFEDTDIASNPTSKVQSHSRANNKSFPQKS